MRRFVFLLPFFVLLCTVPSHAQFTAVSGQVKDVGNNPYSNCSGSANFVPAQTATTVPLIGGSAFIQVVPFVCDGNGNFQVTLVDNNQVSDGHTTGTASQWRFSIAMNNICFVGQDRGFSNTLTITGATQVITGSLTPVTLPLPCSGGGGGGGGTIGGTATAGQIAYGSGVNTITSDANLTWNAGTQAMAIAGSLTGRNGQFLGPNSCATNTSIGLNALASINNCTGTNTAVGWHALTLATGLHNVAVGPSLEALTSGGDNVAVGEGALNAMTTNNSNTAVGNNAGGSSTGNNNIALGASACLSQTSGNTNVCIGGDVNAATDTNEVILGGTSSNKGAGSNTATIGTSATTDTWIGGNTGKSSLHSASAILVGATSGSATIGVAAVAGTPNPINLPTTTGTANQVLQTDGGNPQQTSWATTLPSVVYSTPSASSNASIGATTMTTVGGSDATYRFMFYTQETVVGTSCTGNTSVAVVTIWTDPLEAGPSGASNTTTFLVANNNNGFVGRAQQPSGSGPIGNAGTGSAGLIRAKAGTTIQYSATYTAGTGCAPGPQYRLWPVLEQITAN